MPMWYVPVLLRIFLIDTIFPWLLKGRVVQKNFIQRLFLQYLFCAILAILVAILLGVSFTRALFIMAIIGFFNAFGAYSQWRAIRFNLSATSIFMFLRDLIAISLGYFILKESKFINTGLGIGLIICLSAVILFALNNYRKEKKKIKRKEHIPSKFFFYILSFAAISGITMFLMRYFALEGLDTGTLIVGWYGGAFVATLGLFFFKKEKRFLAEVKQTMISSNIPIMFLMSILIMINIWLTYWVFQLAPIIVVSPIFFISAMIMPAILGIYVFKEGKKYENKEKILFVIAVLGAILIALNFVP